MNLPRNPSNFFLLLSFLRHLPSLIGVGLEVFFKSKLLHLFDLFGEPVDHKHLVGGGGFEDAELEGWEAGAGGVGGAREEAERWGSARAGGGAKAAEEKDCCEQNAERKDKNWSE